MKKSVVVFRYHPPLLTDAQLFVISEIFRETGLIIFATQIAPYIFGSQVDKQNWIMLVLAVILISCCYAGSIFIVRGVKAV
jgi:hypothetical protein